MATIDCMNNDWPWVIITSILCWSIMIGYFLIARNWLKSEKLANDPVSRKVLRDLRNIFVWCGICGYGFVFIRFWWPAWRLTDIAMVILAYFTWSYVLNTRGLRTVYEKLGSIERLEAELAYQRKIAETIPTIIWTALPTGKIYYFNRKWYDYTGMALDQPLETIDWPTYIHPEDLERSEWQVHVQSKSTAPYKNEFRIKNTDGVYEWFMATANPLIDENGEIERWMGAIVNIDDRKREEERLANESQKRKFFLNALSHDLRTPLNSIVLNTHVAEMYIDKNPQQTLNSLNTIKENSQAATTMLNGILEFARLGTDEVNQNTTFDLKPLIEKIFRRFYHAASLKNIALETSCPENVYINTDIDKLDRIISNLLDNALKFSNEGAIKLDVQARGKNLTIFVTDTGSGISLEHQPLLFGEFFQVKNYARDRQKGFGMGLAISRVLARQLGGDVFLQSSSEEGSTFAIRLNSIIKR